MLLFFSRVGSTIAAKCLEVGRVLQVDDTEDGMNT